MIRVFGSDYKIVQAARVSYNIDLKEYPHERNAKLLKRLYDEGHYTPFEHCVIAVAMDKAQFFCLYEEIYLPSRLIYWSDGWAFFPLRVLVDSDDVLRALPGLGDVLEAHFPGVSSVLRGEVPSYLSGKPAVGDLPTVSLDAGKITLVESLELGTDMDWYTFRVECPIFVARQWMRHRFGAYNEKSLRYTRAKDAYVPPSLKDDFEVMSVILSAGTVYNSLIERGVPKEEARVILPLGTMTAFYWTVPKLSLKNFLRLRLSPHAQKEIREFATSIVRLLGWEEKEYAG